MVPTSHKNVLLIIADNLGKNIGPYGCKNVQTPRLDAFATESVKFDLAFASTASCSGSRSVIHTGLHTHQNGQYGITCWAFSNMESCRHWDQIV